MQSTKNTSIFNVTTHYVTVVLSIACLLTTGCADYVARHHAERQKEGMRIINQALEKQHAKAQAEHMANRAALDEGEIARIVRGSSINADDYSAALKVLTPLAEQGNAKAQHNLGLLYEKGQGMLGNGRDYTQAVLWYRKAADQGNVEAQINLGKRYDMGGQDPIQAKLWYRKAADQGNAEAQYYLGLWYDKGQGINNYRVPTEAALWYRKAADQGHAEAQNNLGRLYEIGQGVPQDYTQAELWYRKAADQGQDVAQNNLGRLYEIGQGVPQDYTQAELWYSKAADQGHAEAENNLGRLYDKVQENKIAQYNLNAKTAGPLPGEVEYKAGNYAAALKVAAPLAEHGDAAAQRMMGVLYGTGSGVKQDHAMAAQWHLKSAENGNAESQVMISVMYSRGVGVPQDRGWAVFWLRKAAAQGYPGAREKLAEVAEVNAAYNGRLNSLIGTGVEIIEGMNRDAAASEEYRLQQWNNEINNR